MIGEYEQRTDAGFLEVDEGVSREKADMRVTSQQRGESLGASAGSDDSKFETSFVGHDDGNDMGGGPDLRC